MLALAIFTLWLNSNSLGMPFHWIVDVLWVNTHLGGCGPFYIYGARYFPQQMWDPPVTNLSLLTIGFPFVGYLPCTCGISWAAG